MQLAAICFYTQISDCDPSGHCNCQYLPVFGDFREPPPPCCIKSPTPVWPTRNMLVLVALKWVRGLSMEATMSNPKSTVSIAGHPINPMLIPFPIAFFVATFFCDLAYWQTANSAWAT